MDACAPAMTACSRFAARGAVATQATMVDNSIVAEGATLFLASYALSKIFRAAGVFRPASEAPSYRELQNRERKKKAVAEFGWLQADMRVPLPSLDGLKEACHRIGTRKGRDVFLYLPR